MNRRRPSVPRVRVPELAVRAALARMEAAPGLLCWDKGRSLGKWRSGLGERPQEAWSWHIPERGCLSPQACLGFGQAAGMWPP